MLDVSDYANNLARLLAIQDRDPLTKRVRVREKRAGHALGDNNHTGNLRTIAF
jgi:hypothetical protein